MQAGRFLRFDEEGCLLDIFRKAGAAVLLVMMAMTANPSSAYEVNPMVMELRPSGQGSSTSGVITNSHDVPIAIEIQVFARTQKPDGSDSLVLDTENVIVTPPQTVIQPGESQTFRVSWVGDQAPDRDVAYRLVTNQLPIRFKQEKRENFVAEVMMRYRYEIALYIQPQGTMPKAQLKSARVFEDGTNGRMLELAISSDGTRRAILEKPELQLASGGSSFTVTTEQLAPLVGLNILPGSTRVVRMPAPEGLPLGDLTGDLRTSYLVIS
jgi:fimbrial chaperone protein